MFIKDALENTSKRKQCKSKIREIKVPVQSFTKNPNENVKLYPYFYYRKQGFYFTVQPKINSFLNIYDIDSSIDASFFLLNDYNKNNFIL